MSLENFQRHITANLPIYVFLIFYFLTTVIGNLVYITYFNHSWPNNFVDGFWEKFPPYFLGAEFLLLLIFPMIAVPLISCSLRPILQKKKDILLNLVPEFSKKSYLIINIIIYIYVIFSMYEADSIQLMFSSTDAVNAVNDRFCLLSRLGIYPLIAMQSLLTFTAIYAVISAVRKRELFWYIFAVWHVIVLSSCFFFLNMKWPLVLWNVTLGWAILIASRRGLMSILVCFSVFLLSTASYFAISAIVLRLTPYTDTKSTYTSISSNQEKIQQLITVLINRMALPVPYYYKMFLEKNQLRTSVFSSIIKKDSTIAPSLLVYQEMFGDDGFERGTAPAAAHITGFAISGWTGAITSIILVGIAIGCFLALWPSTQGSQMIATIFVMGCQAAYFWTQLPLEGPIFYTHGTLWWGLMVVLYSFFVFLKKYIWPKNI